MLRGATQHSQAAAVAIVLLVILGVGYYGFRAYDTKHNAQETYAALPCLKLHTIPNDVARETMRDECERMRAQSAPNLIYLASLLFVTDLADGLFALLKWFWDAFRGILLASIVIAVLIAVATMLFGPPIRELHRFILWVSSFWIQAEIRHRALSDTKKIE